MGLGKTLQSIALIHTMVNTKLASKYKLVNRVLLICPLSLRQNWLDEFEKWRIRNFCYIPNNKTEVEKYIAISSRTPVCILNYNIVASYGKILSMSKFDLMICDEGHVLKNTTKIRKTLLDLPSKRRLILTGTPIQNNLKEFFQLTSFVHPNLFESFEDFAQQIKERVNNYLFVLSLITNFRKMMPFHHFFFDVLQKLIKNSFHLDMIFLFFVSHLLYRLQFMKKLLRLLKLIPFQCLMHFDKFVIILLCFTKIWVLQNILILPAVLTHILLIMILLI